MALSAIARIFKTMTTRNVYEKSQTRRNALEYSLQEEIDYFFDKKFSFERPPDGWQLPNPEFMFQSAPWQIPETMEMKAELNAMKSKLNDFNLEKWHKHTRAVNPAGSIMWWLKKSVSPEFMTQAWGKMYELCSCYPIVPPAALETGFFNTVHLCEAPGAFITALNHFLKLNHPNLQWDWIATTLNPYYEENALSTMINDDRWMLHTLPKWKFGYDYTGNIMDLENMKEMVAESKKLGPILLVTADGSIDCQDRPDDQEEIVSQLLFCEIICALHILSARGTFVVKVFTMYEHSTICLMFLLNACFEAVHVFKPVTSKEGNSECYVICTNYNGTEETKSWLRCARNKYSGSIPAEAMFPLLKIPELFMEQLLMCCDIFKSYQIEVLERNIMMFTIDQPKSMIRIKLLKHRMAETFLERYNICQLPNEDDVIVNRKRLTNTLSLNIDQRIDNGTFNEKRQRELLPPKERLSLFMADINHVKCAWGRSTVRWLEFPRSSLKFKILEGKPIKVVRCSKFCKGNLLTLHHQAKAIINLLEPSVEQVHWTAPIEKLSETMERAIAVSCPDILKQEHRIINFQNLLWSSLDGGSNEEFERKAFLELFFILENLWRDVSLIIQGYPMLTQFTAGVTFMLGHLFEQVGFVEPQGEDNAIIFRKFRSRDPVMNTFVDKLVSEAEELLRVGGTKTVLSVIPISDLVENTEFYETVVKVNMAILKANTSKKIKTWVPRSTSESS